MASWIPIVAGGAGAVAGGLLGGPIGAGIGMSLGSAAGGWVDGAFNGPGDVAAPGVDPNAYDPSAFNSISEAARQKAAAAAARQAPETDWSMADADRQMALHVRNRQLGLADDLEAFLRGERDSLADRQLQAATQRVLQQQNNLAANVRGGAGNQLAAMTLAQRQGLAAQVETERMRAEQRAAEEASARGQLAGLLGQTRGQDLDMRGQSQGQARFGTEATLQAQAQSDAQARFFEQLRLQAAQGAAGVTQAQAEAQQRGELAVLGVNAQREAQAQQNQADAVNNAVEGGLGFAMQEYGASKKAGAGPAPAPAPGPAPATGGDTYGLAGPITDSTPAPSPAPAQSPYGSGSDLVDPWAKSGGSSASPNPYGGTDLVDPWNPRRKKP
jgi:hypothetical protein